MLRGLRWKAVSQVVQLALRLVVLAVLARALGPRELGLAAIAVACALAGQAVADAGVGSALVQRDRPTEADWCTGFWMSAAVGTGLAASGVALSGVVAAAFGEPRVAALFAALSAGFLLGALGAVPSALLQRALDFRRLELRSLAAAITGDLVAIGAALAGAGAQAVVAQRLTAAALMLVLVWQAVSWRPGPAVSRASVRDLGRFGLDVLGSRLLFFVQRNADNLLVGRVLGASALGAYAMAYNLALMPFTRIADPVRAVLFPAMAGLQHDPIRLGAAWVRSTRVLIAALGPLLLVLLVAAADLVAVFLGPRWADVVVPVQVLACVGLVQTSIAVNSVVLTALGRTRVLLRLAVVMVAASLAGFVVGLRWGIGGVAVGYLAANLLVVPFYLRLTAAAVGLGMASVASAMRGVAQAAAGVLVAALAARLGLLALGAPAGVRLAVTVVVALGVAVACTARCAPELRAEASSLRRALARPS